MGFAGEMKDFVSSFKAGADIIGGIKNRQDRAADREARRADREESRAEREARLEGYQSAEEKAGANRIRTASSDTPDSGTSSSVSVPKNQEASARERYDYLVNEKGADPLEAAGVVGNTWAEGKFNPMASGDNGTSFGEFQHRDPTPGKGRRTDLMNWAKQNGKDPHDWRTQYDFTYDVELAGPYKGAREAMKRAKTPEEAADAFALHFERPQGAQTGDPNKIHNIAGRRKYASTVFKWGQSDLAAPNAATAGGVLPEPEEEEYYAEGGAVPGVVTKDEVAKNYGRAFTQDVGAPTTGGFVPRRVGSPSPTRVTTTAHGAAPAGTGYGVGEVTPRQQALRTKLAPKPKVAPAVKPAAAAAAGAAGSTAGFQPRSGPAPTLKGFNSKMYDDHFTDENIYGNVAYGNNDPNFNEYARWRLGEAQFNRAIHAQGYARPQGGNNEGVNYYANQPSYNLAMGYAQGGVVDRYMPEEDDDVPMAVPAPEKPMAEDGGGVTDRYMPPEGAPIPEPMDHPDRELASGGDKSLGYNSPEDQKDADPEAAADRLLDRNDAYKLIEKALAPVLAQSEERAKQGIIPEPVREGAEAAGRIAGAAANRAGEAIVDKVNEGVGAANRAGNAIKETVKGVIPDRVFPEGSAGEQMVNDVGGAYDKWAGAVEKNVTVGPAPGESLPERWAAKVRQNVTAGPVPEENIPPGTDPMTADAMPPQPPRRPDGVVPEEPAVAAAPGEGAKPPVDPNAPGPGASTAKQAVTTPQEHPVARRVAKTLSRKLQENGAIPDPTARQSAMNNFLKATDALSPQEYREVAQAVDPDGKLSEADRHIKVQQDLYDYYVAHGNQKKADQAAEAVAMYGKKKSQVAGGMAMAALENGDLRNGVQWLTYGYGYYSSGAVIEIDPKNTMGTEDGQPAIRYRMKDRKTGKPMGDWDTATAGELQQLAGGMATGTTWVNDLLRTAQGKGVATRGPTAADQQAEKNTKQEGARGALEGSWQALQQAQQSGDADAIAKAQAAHDKNKSAYRTIGGDNINTRRSIEEIEGGKEAGALPGSRSTATERQKRAEEAWHADNEKKLESAPDKTTGKALFDAGMTRMWDSVKPKPVPATKIENASGSLPPADQDIYPPFMEEIMGRNAGMPAQRAIAAIDAIRAKPKGLKLVGGRVVVPGFGQPMILSPDLMDRIAKLGPKAAGT